MKIAVLSLVLALIAAACTTKDGGVAGSGEGASHAELGKDGPFKGLGLRFDGYYREERGKVIYLIRFFPQGNAVLANGTMDVEDQLPSLLVSNAQGDPRTGYYNVPVSVKGDSLFFFTKPTRGDIAYRGKVLDGSRVQFLRRSHINGTDQLKEYIFYPDPLPAK